MTATGLTLNGPLQVVPGVASQYSGRLIEVDTGLPIPDKKLRVTVNEVETTYPVTDVNGNFAFTLTFSVAGAYQVRVDYLAVGLLGTPPPMTSCADGDFVMRTCLTTDPITGEILERLDVNTMVCQDNAWVPTGLMCDEGIGDIEPCVCWDGDDAMHPCLPGDDSTRVVKGSCISDKWVLDESKVCVPSEQLPTTCALCDTIWVTCASGLQVPKLTCDAYNTFRATNLDCTRLTTAPDDLTELVITPPSLNTYSTMTGNRILTRLGDLLTIPYRGADSKNHVAVLNTLDRTVRYFGWPSSVDGIAWASHGAALISTDELWAFEMPSSGIMGSPFSLRLVKVNSAGTVLKDLRFGDMSSRAGPMIRLENGSLVGSWHQQYEVSGSYTLGFFIIKPGQEPIIVYPVVVPQTVLGSMASQRNVIVQHPATGDIWFFFHNDSFHNFGYVRLRESPTGLAVVSSTDVFVRDTDPRGIGMWGEIPPITAVPEGDHITLFYPGMKKVCVRTTAGTVTFNNGVFLEVDGEGVITDYTVTPYMVPYLHVSCIRIRADGLRTAFHYRPTPSVYRQMWATTGDGLGWDVQPELLSPLIALAGMYYDARAMAYPLSDKTIHVFI
jgi:hypothetical protein